MEKAKDILEKYLEAWIERDPEKMYKHCQTTWQSNHMKNELRDLFRNINLEDYSIIITSGIQEIMLRKFEVHAKINERNCSFNVVLVCETAAYTPYKDGRWGVNPISILRIE